MFILPQLLGAIYLILFGSLIPQFPGLFGSKGILPIHSYMKLFRNKPFWGLPTLYRFYSSDRFLIALPWAGALLGALLALGGPPALLLPLLFAIHLSIINAGQDFLSFGWETFFCEITFNTWLLTLTSEPNALIWFSLNFLLFRFHFEAGVSKLTSRDLNWRNHSAIYYHYQSQPLPNTQAYYFHKFPEWFHKLSCGLMFFAELVAPFGIFGSEPVRMATCAILIALQVFIWLTGNFSYLNYLTAAFCTILFTPLYSPDLGYDIPLSLVGGALILLQMTRLLSHFTLMPQLWFLWPWRLVNRYGIFAIMTTERIEIIFEGSDDEQEWKPYCFKYKPSEPERRPRRISPLQPRLDWQAWFLPFGNFHAEHWVQRFVLKLLEGQPCVLKLLRHNPFPDAPPRFVRARKVLYTFTSLKEKKHTGRWWNTKEVGIYTHSLKLSKQSDTSRS